MWLFILNKYSSKKCVSSLVVYLYFTSLTKILPKSNISVLNENNVNTAFTTTCPKDSEIIIFRKEEWFKVFIHETFHNFSLDFSDMNNENLHKCILNIFKVDSKVNLYEAYTEFWAEIMNSLFCSFYLLKNKNNINEFLSYSTYFIDLERSYSFFQLVKTLSFMGLNYEDLFSTSETSIYSREKYYKENTNVLSYYIIKTVLMNNYQEFLYWCDGHNSPFLQFKKTIKNQKAFCLYIEQNYKTTDMMQNIYKSQKMFNSLQKNKKTHTINFILSNLRMSICEFG
jgi:hypothetical protein